MLQEKAAQDLGLGEGNQLEWFVKQGRRSEARLSEKQGDWTLG